MASWYLPNTFLAGAERPEKVKEEGTSGGMPGLSPEFMGNLIAARDSGAMTQKKIDAMLPLNFQSRLKELELQIKEEIKEKEKQEGAGGRPRSRRSGEAPASPESPTTVTSPKRKPPPPAGAAFSAFSHNSSTVISSAPVLRAHAHAVKGVRHVPRQVKSQDELTADYKTKAKTARATQRITTRQKLPALSKSRSNTGLR